MQAHPFKKITTIVPGGTWSYNFVMSKICSTTWLNLFPFKESPPALRGFLFPNAIASGEQGPDFHFNFADGALYQ
jgi:hypothetical protein